MTVLRRALGVGALLLLLLSVPLIVVPRTIVEDLLGQTPIGDDVWIRLLGAGCLALGLFHVLIIRRLEDLWWWCWAFVVFDASVAVISLSHAAVGMPEGSAAWASRAAGVGQVNDDRSALIFRRSRDIQSNRQSGRLRGRWPACGSTGFARVNVIVREFIEQVFGPVRFHATRRIESEADFATRQLHDM